MVKTFLRFFLRHPFLKKHYTCDDSTTTPVLTALLFIVLALVVLVLTAPVLIARVLISLVLIALVLMALMLVMSSTGAYCIGADSTADITGAYCTGADSAGASFTGANGTDVGADFMSDNIICAKGSLQNKFSVKVGILAQPA